LARSRAPRPSRAAPPASPAPPAHPADRALWASDKSALPPEHHEALDAIRSAFQKYEAGDDDATRAVLQTIGLQSPFLEWKVLLRGLMAYSANDDVRAIENWQRLAPDRLPFRVAAPLRAAIDPAFKRAQSPNEVGKLQQQFRTLLADPMVNHLRDLPAELSGQQSLKAAYRRAEQIRPRLRELAPDLLPRLANLYYRTLLAHGSPTDLMRHRGTFGSPPDDPDFHKLEAIIHEQSQTTSEANRHWAAYEAWLATHPPSWPADVTQRARALVFYRMAENVAEDEDDEEDDDPFGFFAAPRSRGRRAKPPDPVPMWRKAMDLAPGWEPPARELFNHLAAAGKVAEAEAIARKLLEHSPSALPVLESLAGLLSKAGRAADVLVLRTQALAANPLDKRLRILAAYAYNGAARRQLIDGDWAGATATLDAGQALSEEGTPTSFHSLRATIAHKAGRLAEAEDWRAKALAVPSARLAATLYLSVNALLAKLKPKDRKPLDAALAEAFAGAATPREANLLYAAWDMYGVEGLTYRGQPAQEKKIHALILRVPDGDGDLLDFEVMAQSAAMRNEWKLVQKLAPKLRTKFPRNPVFPLLLAEFEFAKTTGYPRPLTHRLLADAKQFAEASPEPRHRELLPRIAELQRQLDPGFLFSNFFGR